MMQMEEINMETGYDGKPTKRIKLELADRPLNFAVSPDDLDFHFQKKPKAPRDPMSHRIIEKRRRDRMNNCLADLSRLIPSTYLKQGQGRIEKTEIIELAIKHIEHLTKLCNYTVGDGIDHLKLSTQSGRCCEQKFYMGFKECQDELMRFFVEEEGWDSKDKLLLKTMNHMDISSKKFRSDSGCMDENGDLQIGKMEKDEVISDDGNSSYSFLSNSGGIVGDSQLSPQQNQSHSQIESCIGPNKSVSNQHLRTLLTKTASGSNDNVSVTSNGTDSCIFMSLAGEGSAHMRREEDSSFCGTPMERANTHCESEQSNNSGVCEKNVYKFKHNITKRFSLEEKHHVKTGSDSSSSSSHEDSNVKVKRRAPRAKAESPSGDETPYPNSEHSSCENVTGYGSPKSDTCNKTTDSVGSNVSLPAFLLHPSGTHYVPFSVHPSQVKNVVSTDKSLQNVSVFHPISIPVNFGGNYISMQNINVDSNHENTEKVMKSC